MTKESEIIILGKFDYIEDTHTKNLLINCYQAIGVLEL
jgi:hypothetical protein